MTTHPFDIIGDVHGHFQSLLRLGGSLGYDTRDHWRHPDDRRLLFLGDLIDRGPNGLDVAELVQGLVEDGRAVCLMGNHEHNLLDSHLLGGKVRTSSAATWAAVQSDLRHDQTALLQAIVLLEAVGRLEGYVVKLRLDAALVSVDEAISAVREVLAGAPPRQQAPRGESHEQETREHRPRGRRRRTAHGVQDAAAAMQFFLELTGIETPTTRADLSRALRRGALELHPDVRPGDAKAQEEFCLFKMGFEETLQATPEG